MMSNSAETERVKYMREILFKDIRENPGTWVEDIARRLGWNRQTVSRYARMLIAEGKVRVTKKGPVNEFWPGRKA